MNYHPKTKGVMRPFVPIGLSLTLTLSVATARAPVPKGEAPIRYYPTQVGWEWVFGTKNDPYRATIQRREVKDGNVIVTCALVDGDMLLPGETMLLSDQGLFLIERQGAKYDPPECLLRWPLQAGSEWITTTKVGEYTLTTQHKMGREEWIEVPAGRFKAVPVTEQLITTGAQYKPTMSWYSPGLGCIKRQSGEMIQVLHSF